VSATSFIQIFPPQHVNSVRRPKQISNLCFWSASSAWSWIAHGFRARVNVGSTHPPFGCVFWVFGLHRQHGHGLVMDFELHDHRLSIDVNSRGSWNENSGPGSWGRLVPCQKIRTWRFVEKTFRVKKYFLQTTTKVCHVKVTVDLPTFCLVTIFSVESKELELEVEQPKQKIAIPVFILLTWNIHTGKIQQICQHRKLIVIPGVWRKSTLRFYGCVLCSISLLSVYMCVRIPLSSRSIVGVSSSRALPGFPSNHLCAFLIDH